MLYFIQQILNGIHMGALYALLAFGYALANGVLHRTNLTHGALFGFAGQIFVLASTFGYQALWLTFSASLAFAGLVALAFGTALAWALSRSILERIADRSPNAVIAVTLAVSIVLMELGRIAADTKDLWLSPVLQAPVVFAHDSSFTVTLTTLQIVNAGLALLIIAVAARLLTKSPFGRAWRGVSDDPLAAALCGVEPRRTFRQTMVMSGALAALAGIMAALYYGNIGFGTGLIFGLKVLFVTAVGGYGAPASAALGAFLFGIGESLWAGYFPIEWRDGWMFAFLVAMLVLRIDTATPDRVGAGPIR